MSIAQSVKHQDRLLTINIKNHSNPYFKLFIRAFIKQCEFHSFEWFAFSETLLCSSLRKS